MTYRLSSEEYEHTKIKLANCEQRLMEMESRSDISASRRALALRSQREFIAQLRAELALYEAAQEFGNASLSTSKNVASVGIG